MALAQTCFIFMFFLETLPNTTVMAHSHCTGTGPGQRLEMGQGHNVHIAQGLVLGTRPGNIMQLKSITKYYREIFQVLNNG